MNYNVNIWYERDLYAAPVKGSLGFQRSHNPQAENNCPTGIQACLPLARPSQHMPVLPKLPQVTFPGVIQHRTDHLSRTYLQLFSVLDPMVRNIGHLLWYRILPGNLCSPTSFSRLLRPRWMDPSPELSGEPLWLSCHSELALLSALCQILAAQTASWG